MLAAANDLRTWERAEIVRSASEASHTPDATLALSPATRARYRHPPGGTPYPLEYAFHLLGDVSGRTVIDLGCGSGPNTALLAQRGARLIGVDISTDLLLLAGRRLRVNGITDPVGFLASSAHDLPVPDASVDVVFGIAILHHLDLDLVAAEVRRVLRPGGRAIFQEPVRNSKVLRFLRRLIPYRAPDVSPFERPLTDAELRRFARGFSGFSARAFSLPHINLARLLPLSQAQRARAYRADRALLGRWPRLAHYAAIRVFTVTR